jgi:hypothetical protein
MTGRLLWLVGENMAFHVGKLGREDIDVKTVPELLRKSAKIYEQRNKVYGDTYKRFGKVMTGLFPTGMRCNSEEDFNRMGCLVQVVGKLVRYSAQFDRFGHEDSLEDLAVYTMMLQELDDEMRGKVEDQSEEDRFTMEGYSKEDIKEALWNPK